MLLQGLDGHELGDKTLPSRTGQPLKLIRLVSVGEVLGNIAGRQS